MIPFKEAYDTVMSSAFSTGTEIVPLERSLNRILASDVRSDMDMPPFNKATVDGFACRREDFGHELEIIETIPAGKWPEKTVGAGQCARIMTGASVPEGANCVVMVEETLLLSTGKLRFTGTATKDNIAARGEDIRNGDIVLRSGRQIRPQDIAVMASVGYVNVRAGRKPSVAVISSGSELVEPSEQPGISQIRNSNSGQLMAQIEQAGADGKYYGIARDDEDETLSVVKKAVSDNDIIVITGGVSMGDFDFVPSVLEKAGVKILFTRVAVQPGKPTTFGIHYDAVIFGLPGNPVSSFIQFELLVKPLIFKMMSGEFRPVTCLLPMKDEFARKSVERMMIIPVKVTPDRQVVPVEYHGSAHISALPGADGVISMEAGKKVIGNGEIVEVRYF